MQPGKTSGYIAYTPMCDAEQQQSQNEETISIEESYEYKIASLFSHDATSEIQDPALTTH
jgi:hypothetical protein